jgi:TRAP-type C4-dicarboxylate transport system substrate-binding protein
MNRLALAVFLAASAASAQAVPVRIKLGTLAPQGSTWHQLLMEMGADFTKASGGKVELKIYAGGTQGNEGEMIREMSFGKLQAASITAIGMHEITPEPQAEDVPFMIDSYEEYDYVHAKIRAKLEEALLKRGYQVLQWGEVGFVYLFSTEPFRAPEDFGKGKVFTWNGDPGAEAAWKAAGFRPVVLSSTDLVSSLTTGMINIVGESPLYAYTTNIFAKADHMLNLHWGFLTGATVVKRDTWEKIPQEVREKLLAIAADYEKKTRDDVRKQDADAVEQMKKRGLHVEEPANIAGWNKAADAAADVVRGKVVPVAIYDEVKKLRDEYRAQHKQ